MIRSVQSCWILDRPVKSYNIGHMVCNYVGEKKTTGNKTTHDETVILCGTFTMHTHESVETLRPHDKVFRGLLKGRILIGKVHGRATDEPSTIEPMAGPACHAKPRRVAWADLPFLRQPEISFLEHVCRSWCCRGYRGQENFITYTTLCVSTGNQGITQLPRCSMDDFRLCVTRHVCGRCVCSKEATQLYCSYQRPVPTSVARRKQRTKFPS